MPNLLQLDHSSRLPLHVQAEELLRKMIRQPAFRKGGLLPDEVSLASHWGISRNTLRAAIGRLVNQELLERKAGLGTRVCEPRVNSGIGAWHSFTREMEAKGIKVETYSTVVKRLPAPPEAAAALRIREGTSVLSLCRVRGWDGRPEVEFCSYFHPRLKLSGDEDFDQPLYELIREKTSAVADESLEKLTAISADRRLAGILRVRQGDPLLRRERTVLDKGKRPMEFAIVHYRCQRFNLTLNLRQE